MKHSGMYLFAAVPIAVLLASCTYSQINPEAALEDIRTNNGYYELKSIEPGTAKLVLRTPGAVATSAAAQFAVSTAEAPCEGFRHLGAAASSGHGIVYPWIARATRVGSGAEPFLVHQATPGQPIQIRGIGNWSTGGTTIAFQHGSCGPVALRFTPAENRAYTVEFIWGKNMTCRLAVMDATDPDALQPVAASTASQVAQHPRVERCRNENPCHGGSSRDVAGVRVCPSPQHPATLCRAATSTRARACFA